MLCADCTFWEPGEFWSAGNNKTIVAAKGWCKAKKNKRKCWNYHPACEKLFNEKEKTTLIIHGVGPITEMHLQQVIDFINGKNKLKNE